MDDDDFIDDYDDHRYYDDDDLDLSEEFCTIQVSNYDNADLFDQQFEYCQIKVGKFRGVGYVMQHKEKKLFMISADESYSDSIGEIVYYSIGLTDKIKSAAIFNFINPDEAIVPDGFELIPVCC